MICTPHLGASTVEAQEAVAVEVAEAVVNALQGELASTAVNAPMVPKEVLAELQPYVALAEVREGRCRRVMGGWLARSAAAVHDSGRRAIVVGCVRCTHRTP